MRSVQVNTGRSSREKSTTSESNLRLGRPSEPRLWHSASGLIRIERVRISLNLSRPDYNGWTDARRKRGHQQSISGTRYVANLHVRPRGRTWEDTAAAYRATPRRPASFVLTQIGRQPARLQ